MVQPSANSDFSSKHLLPVVYCGYARLHRKVDVAYGDEGSCWVRSFPFVKVLVLSKMS